MGVHESHCYQGEYLDVCKYRDSNCPMKLAREKEVNYLKYKVKEADRRVGLAHLRLDHNKEFIESRGGAQYVPRHAVDELLRALIRLRKARKALFKIRQME